MGAHTTTRERERRAANRTPFAARARFGAGSEGSSGFVANVSETGLALVGQIEPELGGKLTVSFRDAVTNEDVVCDVEIVWREPLGGERSVHRFGARVRETTGAYRNRARAMIERQQNRGSLRYPWAGLDGHILGGWEIADVVQTRLPAEAKRWVVEYSEVGGRNPFLWQWVWHGLGLITLDCVDPELVSEARRLKLLGVMLDTVIDDVADVDGGSPRLDALMQIPLEASSSVRSASDSGATADPLLRLAGKLWSQLSDGLQALPRYDEFNELLTFDHHQLMNSMRYAAALRRQPELLNTVEHDLYQPHNMYIVAAATIDLMASPGFETRELGTLRAAVNHAQVLGRIANMATTWQRELLAGDFSSGLFCLGLERGVFDLEALADPIANDIEGRILASGLEQELLDLWAGHREELGSLTGKTQSVDLGEYARGQDRVLKLYLGCWGLV